MAVRSLRQAFARLRRHPHHEPVIAPPSPQTTILDNYCSLCPSPQNAVDLFRGEWSSKLPNDCGAVTGAGAELFSDGRIKWGLDQLGGVAGKRVLELGPLEGAHSAMLEWAGAAEVTAIEANSRAYLKCLITKETLGLKNVRFLCGDLMEYLRAHPPRFDVVLAVGVLYHMRQPAEMLLRLAKITDRVVIWTQYFDADRIDARPDLKKRFPSHHAAEWDGFRCTHHRYEYLEALNWTGFCGGSAPYAHWLTKADILACLRHGGFDDIRVTLDQPEFQNGPAFLLSASRSAK
jgi:SAM-dependent methyltransferase